MAFIPFNSAAYTKTPLPAKGSSKTVFPFPYLSRYDRAISRGLLAQNLKGSNGFVITFNLNSIDSLAIIIVRLPHISKYIIAEAYLKC